MVVGGGFTAMITHFGKDELRHPLVGTLVCGGDLIVDIKSAGRGNRVACVDAAGVEIGQASQFAGLKLMAPAWIIFAGIGLYLLSLRARKSAP
ncbi:hypothetical protein [Reyranella sp. CPCC 100927]|uniref:hypothetical protein n=1 Tax=Reyranella sp. CPCC 100927 TaxID=2599616 RepID=UPI0011B432C9|nr:hypothetical protein [Reyranella sp. CPCC 100927]TWT11440.1 hypothetical protein FQU96_13200 [Reyranella sp. CPCC 100927]